MVASLAKSTTSGRHSVAMGKGLDGGVVGQVAMFLVQCKDAHGENRTSGGDVVVAKLQPPAGRGAPIDCHVIDNSDGSYTCTYLPVKALRNVPIMVTVNGTRLAATPFKASFEPGKTEPSNCLAFGDNVHHGLAGSSLSFQVVARDAYSNQRTSGGDAFKVHVKPLAALNVEFEQHFKKWAAESTVVDGGSGVYDVRWRTDLPGWYTVSVFLDRVPVHGAPFKVCVLGPVARAPSGLEHRPCLLSAASAADARPPPVAARACALVHSSLVVRKPLQPDGSGRLPKHDVFHLFDTAERTWARHEARGPALPAAVDLAGFETTLYVFAHGGAAGAEGPIEGVHALSLDALRATGQLRRHELATRGPRPAACAGAQVVAVGGALGGGTVWFVGGKDAEGRLDDVFAFDVGSCTWTAHHSDALGVAAAGEPMAKREGHSVVAFQNALWVFGGRSDGGTLADLHCLDTAGGVCAWKATQPTGELPAPREHHTAVVVAPTGYMLLVGGLDESGGLAEDVSICNLYGLSWSRLKQGVVPRLAVACVAIRGELFTFGGTDAGGFAFDEMSVLDLAGAFAQRSCLELSADTSEYVVVKGQSMTLGALRNTFTLEAWVLARSFPPYATVVSKADNGWKCGFGLAKYGAGKGDAEEVPQLNFWMTPGYVTTKVSAQIEPHVWTHLCGSYDGAHIKIYVNGRLTDTVEFKCDKPDEVDGLQNGKADLYIGAHPNKAAWDGLIDEVRLWNVTRSDADVRAQMHALMPTHTAGLIGQWTFNEGNGPLVIDSSGCRNHGTIEGTLSRCRSTRIAETTRPDGTEPAEPAAAPRRTDDAASAHGRWHADFTRAAGGREPTRADMLLGGDGIISLARQLGLFD
jgi:hypothetical protein